MRSLIVLAVLFVAICGEAKAAAPTLQSVGQQDRHPTAVFSAPGADDASISISSSPDQATDGNFLSENYKGGDSLTDAEIASGVWMDEDQLDPGVYYVMLTAHDWDQPACDPVGCYSSRSAVTTLTVPKPVSRYRAKFKSGYIASFTLTVTPLGESLPYKLCWTRPRGRKCLRSSVAGYDWNKSASDTEYLTAADLKLGKRKRTTFVWYVHGKRVASKTIRVR